MPDVDTFSLSDRYLCEEGKIQLGGVHAIVRVLLDQVRHDRDNGRNIAGFVSGYEGSPLAGLDLELARQRRTLAEHGITHLPGLNEELAATSVFGTQVAHRAGALRGDGVFGAWYGKAPGLDRAADALRHANMAGTHPLGGAVAFVGDDPNAKSSSVPSASEHLLADLGIPVFSPGDSQDVLDLGRHAVEMSRACGVWTAVKMVADVADASSTTLVRREWSPPALEGAYRHQPSARLLGAELAALERSLYEIRLPLVTGYLRSSDVNRVINPSGEEIGIVAAGKSYLDVEQALRKVGAADVARHGVRLLKLGVIFPLDKELVREFARGVKQIVVVEEKRGILEPAIKEALYGLPDAPPVRGKELFPARGELDPDQIARRLAHEVPGARIVPVPRARVRLPLATRTPYFCSGCPHSSSTRAPDGAVVGGGIGCHTMTLFQPASQVGEVVGITQMGGEGAQWLGIAPFVDTDRWIQNIGDGTFFHSGSLAVRAAVAAGVDVTYKLLHNSAVAMTGGQTATGRMPLRRLVSLLQDEGVAKIVVTSDEPRSLRRAGLPRGVGVRDRRDIVQVQEELAAVAGVTVLIHDQECAAELRRRRRRGKAPAPTRRVAINERVCEGCGDCGAKSNCLSVRPVDTPFGRKTRVHQGSCNVDKTCLDGSCPSFLLVEPGHGARVHHAPLAAEDLPEPPAASRRDVAVRIAGVGGTGVVTVAQILTMAAFLGGRHVRTLDQTGLAQKGGAVVSDVRISSDDGPRAARLAAGECDVYLGADLLVAADPVNLRCTSPETTSAVVSTAEIPTGEMVAGRAAAFPDAEGLHSSISDAVDRAHFFDAHAAAERYLGSDQYANTVLLGAAFQQGLLPVGGELLERAIALNGADVEKNVQAFRRGRQIAAGGAPAEAPAAPSTPSARVLEVRELARTAVGPHDDLSGLLEHRVTDLWDYQDARYARTYAGLVQDVSATPGVDVAVVEAFARQLYRLMAYKDEYEVARLSLDAQLQVGLDRDFGPGARYRFQLRPPVLSALGLRGKISVGPWFRVVFRVLRALRRVRGTVLDPFGYAAMRRRERRLVAQYTGDVRLALSVAPGSSTALEVAELPETVRGFDEVKLASLEEYEQRRHVLLASLEASRPVPVR